MIVLWMAVALFSAPSSLYGLFALKDSFLAAVMAYATLTAVSSILGHLKILAGKTGGGALICTPCVPPLLFFALVLASGGRDLGEFGLGGSLLPVTLAFAFLLANVAIGWRASRNHPA